MVDCFKEAKILRNDIIYSCIKLGTQNGQTRLQDNVDLTRITDKSFIIDNYECYKHRYITPIGFDVNEITCFNNKVLKLHLDKMKIRNNNPTKTENLNPVQISLSYSISFVYAAR